MFTIQISFKNNMYNLIIMTHDMFTKGKWQGNGDLCKVLKRRGSKFFYKQSIKQNYFHSRLIFQKRGHRTCRFTNSKNTKVCEKSHWLGMDVTHWRVLVVSKRIGTKWSFWERDYGFHFIKIRRNIKWQ